MCRMQLFVLTLYCYCCDGLPLSAGAGVYFNAYLQLCVVAGANVLKFY